MDELLPLFPLNIVVYPGEKVNLHIFEPRYIELINDVYASDRFFGMPTYLKNNIEYAQNTILLVSFMAQDTLGRKLKDGMRRVRIFGEEYDVRAQVASIDGYSAHADQDELLEWAASFDPDRLQRVILVHGEPGPMSVFASKLQQAGVRQVVTPQRGERLEM